MEKDRGGNVGDRIVSLWRDLFKTNGTEKKANKNFFLLLILLLGIILMFTGSFLHKPQQQPDVIAGEITEEKELFPEIYNAETDLAVALEQILEHIDGISDVHVFINYAASKEAVYARSFDESSRSTLETDREGGTREVEEINRREEQVLLRDGGGGEEALLLKELMPEIQGVLVVARGAENSYIRLEVVRSIQNVLNLPAHRIALLPHGN